MAKLSIKVNGDRQIWGVMQNLAFLGHFDTFEYVKKTQTGYIVRGLDPKDETKQKEYRVSMPMLRRGFLKFMEIVLSGQAPGWVEAMGLTSHYADGVPIWDALAGDKLLQFAVYGKEVFD